MGPSRDKYDLVGSLLSEAYFLTLIFFQLREQLAYWKTTSAEEKKRREQAEADAVMAKEDAQEGAKLELHNYIQEYEKECANHYGKEAADLRQQLRALQGHSMGVLNDLNQERERAVRFSVSSWNII
jgi:regulator of replication initiation timing